MVTIGRSQLLARAEDSAIREMIDWMNDRCWCGSSSEGRFTTEVTALSLARVSSSSAGDESVPSGQKSGILSSFQRGTTCTCTCGTVGSAVGLVDCFPVCF